MGHASGRGRMLSDGFAQFLRFFLQFGEDALDFWPVKAPFVCALT